jgi:hypothetical protein
MQFIRHSTQLIGTSVEQVVQVKQFHHPSTRFAVDQRRDDHLFGLQSLADRQNAPRVGTEYLFDIVKEQAISVVEQRYHGNLGIGGIAALRQTKPFFQVDHRDHLIPEMHDPFKKVYTPGQALDGAVNWCCFSDILSRESDFQALALVENE